MVVVVVGRIGGLRISLGCAACVDVYLLVIYGEYMEGMDRNEE